MEKEENEKERRKLNNSIKGAKLHITLEDL